MFMLLRILAFGLLSLVGLIQLPRADVKAQWFAGRYPGARTKPNVLVLHTTEGTDWPSYDGGATAPNVTVKPDLKAQTLIRRQHFSLDESSRALRNEAGGVETNTLNAVQVELIGTCSPATHADWTRRGVAHIYWPRAPRWALQALGLLLKDINAACPGIPLTDAAVRGWLAYGVDSRRPGVTPASYGASPARLTGAEWRNATGVLGHQHVPENHHGDPGDIDIDRILEFAGVPVKPTVSRGPAIDKAEALLVTARRRAVRNDQKVREQALSALLRQLRNTLPAAQA